MAETANKNSSSPKTHLLFIAGYYGTELFEDNKLVWPNALEILMGSKTLELPIGALETERLDQLRTENQFQLGDVVKEVRFLGGLIKIGAYQKTLTALKKLASQLPNCRFSTIPWDWRMDPREGALAIDQKLNSLQLQTGDKVYLVAHSYGGLALSYYLRYGTQDYHLAQENWQGLKRIDKSVMVATPFRGTLGVFKNVFHGQARGANKNILSPRAFSTFPSSYFLLPAPGYAQGLNAEGQVIDIDVWNVENWQRYNWGFFSNTNKLKNPNSKVLLKFKSEQLQRAQIFHRLTLADSPNTIAHEKIYYIEGGDVPTLERCFWAQDNRQALQNCYFLARDLRKYAPKVKPTEIFVPGDGTLPAYSSAPLKWMIHPSCSNFKKLSMEHLQVLEMPLPMKLISEYLQFDLQNQAKESQISVSQIPANP